MKRILTFFILTALLLSASLLHAQTDKTLVKSFNLQGQSALVLQLGFPAEVRTWASESVQVQMNIHLNSGSENNLKSLIATGRYNIVSEITPTGLQISCPALQRAVKYNGSQVNEVITFVIFAPSNMAVQVIGESVSVAPVGADIVKSL